MRNLCQEWTQIASNDERDLLRLRSPMPGNPAPTVMGHYCVQNQNAARRVHGSAPEHPPARLPLPLPCPCIQDLPRPDSSPTHGFTPAARQATRLPIPCSHCPSLAPSPAPAAAAAPAPAAPAPPARASMSQKITVARSAGQTTLRAHIASPAHPSLPETTVAHSGVHKVNNCTKSNEKRNRRRRANSFFCFNSQTLLDCAVLFGIRVSAPR